MTIKIDKKIVGYKTVKDEKELPAESEETKSGDKVIQMHEKLERPAMLQGSTYKITTPLSEHALYVTINDIILNPGTEYELRRPFELFINSKNMEYFQWIVALTRIISAVFRKGGDITFLVEELRSVFDPHGGYFKKGGKFMPSLVAEIGDVLESHLRMIGLLKSEELDEHTKKLLAEKKQAYQQLHGDADTENFPESATLCSKCLTKAMIYLDNCLTCLNCGESKCS